MASSSVTRPGAATVVLGCDQGDWTTNSSAHGSMSSSHLEGPRPCAPPGGTASVDFGAQPEQVSAEELRLRPTPGGQSRVMLGADANTWQTNSSVNGVGSLQAVVAQVPVQRQAPGGVASISLAAGDAHPVAQESVQRSPPGGRTQVVLGAHSSDWSVNSTALGAGCAESAANFVSMRTAPGGTDSINFANTGDGLSADALLKRNHPGGNASVVLGGDDAEWKTNSSAHGFSGFTAVANMDKLARQAPGGVDNVDFCPPPVVQASAETLLARPCVGGADSVEFGKTDVNSETAKSLLVRPSPGGAANVVLGSENGTWATDSSMLGTGSVEAIVAAESRERVVPGGVDSVGLGVCAEQISAQELLARPSPGGSSTLDFAATATPGASVEELIVRPSPGGATTVSLGADGQCWTTDSRALGLGSKEAAAQHVNLVPPLPGGKDSVDFSSKSDVVGAETLLARPAVGGSATVVLGGYAADWRTDSAIVGTGAIDAVGQPTVHHAPGGVDSIDFSASSAPVHSNVLLARQSPGGAANVVLGGDNPDWAVSSRSHGVDNAYASGGNVVRHSPTDTLNLGAAAYVPSVDTLLARPSPGGHASVVLGGDSNDWGTHSRVHGVGSAEAVAAAASSVVLSARAAPGGADSIDFGKATIGSSAEDLLKRPATGGSSTMTLGDIGAVPATGVSSNRFASGSNPNAGNCITDRSSTRLHQAPGGTSTICLGEDVTTIPTVSADRFANGRSQNVGNCITDRPTTRLHQAPGGNSSISLADSGTCPAVGTSTSRQEQLSGETSSRLSTKVKYAPGGASSLCLGQDENVNSSNIIQADVQGAIKQSVATEGRTGVVLG